MTFPVILSTTATNGTTATDTPVINLPTGTSRPASGNLLIAIARMSGGDIGTFPAADWNSMSGSHTDGSGDFTVVGWHNCTGDEPTTITMEGTAVVGKFAALVMNIGGATMIPAQVPDITAPTSGNSTTPQPNSLTPSGGPLDFLWIWLGGWEGEQTSPPAGTPTNYGSASGANSGTAGDPATNCRVAKARRVINASTETPSSWTISASGGWVAFLVAVYPSEDLDQTYVKRRQGPRRLQAVHRSSVV